MRAKLQPVYSFRRDSLRGLIHQIHALEHVRTFDSHRVFTWIADHRMAVSKDGLALARVYSFSAATEHIEHNLSGLVTPAFQSMTRERKEIKTRILEVHSDRLLVWGLPVNMSVCGVYEIRAGSIRPKLVRMFERLDSVMHTPNGVCLRGADTLDAETECVWTSRGVLPMDALLSLSVTSDGNFLFLEGIRDTVYRYQFGVRGFTNLFPVFRKEGEQAIALSYVQNQYVLVTRSKSESYMRVLGARNMLSFTLKETWSGEIEHLWVSPSERSLAWCVKPDPQKPAHRALYVNGQCVHEGDFLVNASDFQWAPSGSAFGVRILTLPDVGAEKEQIITSDAITELPAGVFLREFLVDVDGGIAAMITDNGERCSPVIYARSFQEVPCAWNLRWIPGGGISFHSILKEGIVCLTVDETEILRH